MTGRHSKWFYLGILAIIWGSSFILIKKSLLGLSPYQLGALRVVLTGLFLFLAGFKRLRRITVNEWKWIGVSGFLGSFFPSFFFAFAETEIDSAVASIINSLVPLNTILLGFSVFKITSTRRQVVGVIIGFIGAALLILKGAHLNPGQNYYYAIFVIMATIMYAFNVNIIKRYLQQVSPLNIALGNYVIISVPALIVLGFTDFFSATTFQNPEIKMALVYLTLLSLFGTAMAKVLFNKLVQMSTPVFASSVTYLIPIVALMWGVLDNEKFGPWQILAALIIFLGVYLSHRKRP